MAINTRPTPEKEIRALQKTFDVTPTGRLFISVPGADLDISASTTEKVDIEVFVKSQSENEALALTDRVKLRMRAVDKQTVRVESKSFYQNGFVGWNTEDALQMRLSIRVPRSFNIDIQASGSRIALQDLEGKQSIQLSGGSLTTRNMGGRLEIYGFGSALDVREFDGAKLIVVGAASSLDFQAIKAEHITIRASSCSSTLANFQGQASLAFFSGNAEVKHVSGPLDAQVHGCQATFYLDQVDDTYLEICGGQLGLHLTSDLKAKLLLEGDNLYLDKELAFSGDQEIDRIEGRLNKGKNLLHAHAASGSIRCVPA
jgi:hypothetical protein